MNLGYAIRQNQRVEERRREREQREENPLMGLRKNEYETKKNERERESEREKKNASILHSRHWQRCGSQPRMVIK